MGLWDFVDNLYPEDNSSEDKKSVTVRLPTPKAVTKKDSPKADKSSTMWDFVDGYQEETPNEPGPGIDRRLRTVGENAARGLVTSVPYIIDVLNALAMSPLPGSANKGQNIKPALLGEGDLTSKVSDWFTQNHQTVTPQYRGEKAAASISQGVGAGLPFGGAGIISGATGGAGADVASEAFPDSEWAPFIGGLVGGVAPAGPHIVRNIRGSVLKSRGVAHPMYGTFVDDIIPALEGGGSIESPKTNPKSGAFGPMQVTPETLRQPGYGIKPWNGTVEDSIRIGREKFAALLGKYRGDAEKALAGYNWGEGNVDKTVRKYGDKWLLHAPDETKNYVNKGMLRAYGGGDLPKNTSVRPIPPEETARIMNDPEAAGIGDSATAQPDLPEPPDNIINLGAVREALDNQKIHDLLADKLDSAYAHEDAALRGEMNITPDRATENRIVAEKLHESLPEDHSLREMTSDLVNTWRSAEQTIYENHGQKPPSLEDLQNSADKFIDRTEAQRREPINDISAADAEDRYGLYGFPDEEPPTNPSGGGGKQRSPFNDEPASSRTFGTRPADPRARMRNELPHRSEEGHPDAVPPSSDEPTVAKLVDAINQAKPLRNQQKTMISKERAKRFQKVAQIYASAEGPAAYRMALNAMKGQMGKPDFEGIGHQFDANEIQFLFDKIGKNNRLTPGEKLTGHSGLQKLLSVPAGEVPTTSELNVLSQIFPKELIDGLQKENPYAHIAAQVMNAPRTIMASFDLSAPFRQGVFLVGRKEFYKAWGPMLKAFASEKAFKEVQNEIASRPSFRLMQKAGLALTDEGNVLTKREEQFMSNWAEKIPVIGQGVRMSSRGYMAFLNKLRADVFDTLVRQAESTGLDLDHDQHALHSIARFINNATGRGDLGRWNTAAPVLNGIFFSPRLIASRINTMNPIWYSTLHPFARKEALKSLLSFSAVALTILGLAKLSGADVEADPRSADFGKIKTGNTRYDILGGYQQFIRSGAQIITGQTKGADGEIQSLTTGDFGKKTRLDVAQNFVYNKFAPVPSFVIDWARGKDAVGNKFQLDKEVINRVTPMVAQDAISLYKDGGPGEVPQVIPGIFGVGVQTYTPREKKSPGRPSSQDDPFAYLDKAGGEPFDYLDDYGKQ